MAIRSPGSAINSQLVEQYKTTLAQLLRRRPETPFTLELAVRWLREEHAKTGIWPSVITECIQASESDGYYNLTGNALNKKLRKLRTTLKELKDGLLNSNDV